MMLLNYIIPPPPSLFSAPSFIKASIKIKLVMVEFWLNAPKFHPPFDSASPATQLGRAHIRHRKNRLKINKFNSSPCVNEEQ